ncbi:MAG: YceH family protein [Lysobacterales bacterium]
MNDLTPIQVRVLGCLMEKKETTPDQYPLTLNALRNACNQKTSRYPVVAYSEGEVGHTLRELEALDMVREEWGARVPKYQHLANKALNLHSQGIALICTLMLRGPQTLAELKTNTHRLFDFDDIDDVQFALQHLIDREPSLVAALPRQPGQKEGRFAHLLSGEPVVPVAPRATAVQNFTPGLEARVAELETQIEDLHNRLKAIEGGVDH